MAYSYSRADRTTDPGITSIAGLDADAGDVIIAEGEDDYAASPGGSLLVLATGSSTARTLADWTQRIDYYVKPAGAGSDSLSAITTAITAAGAGGVVSLIPGHDYELSSNINLNLDDITFLIPAGSSLTLRSGVSQPAIRVNADRVSIIGAGPSTSKIDCKGRQNGIVVASGAVGSVIEGLLIIDPINRGVAGTDCFSATDRLRWRNVRVVYTAVGVAAVGMTYIPLLINLQGDLAVDVENIELDVEVDLTAFTVQQIAEIGYPTSGVPNVVGVRVNQSGTGYIKNYSIKSRVIFPFTTDGDNWDPTTYGHVADGAGRRRPTCVELKTTAANQVLEGDFNENFARGGALGHSFGSLKHLRYSNNRTEWQTDYNLEAATGEKIVGTGNYFDGRYAGRALATTNIDHVELPCSTIIGPSAATSAFTAPTIIATVGCDTMNFDGSNFTAANASIPIWRIDGDGQTISAQNVTFDGAGLSGVVGVVVETGTVAELDLTGAIFTDIAGNSIEIAATGVVTRLITRRLKGRSAGAYSNSGTVTNHHQGDNIGISGLVGRAPTMSGVNFDTASPDLQYQGVTFCGLRSTHFTLHTATSDAADNRYFAFCGGGAAGEFRGATLYLYGNEEGTSPGKAVLQSGVNRDIELDAKGTGDILFKIDGTEMARISTAGNLALASGKAVHVNSQQVVGARQTAITNVAVTFTANNPGFSANQAVTIADGATPTVVELLHYIQELHAMHTALLGKLDTNGHGLLAVTA